MSVIDKFLIMVKESTMEQSKIALSNSLFLPSIVHVVGYSTVGEVKPLGRKGNARGLAWICLETPPSRKGTLH